METTRLLQRFLDVIEHDIVPKTARGVAAGNKLFGAAILRKSDLSLVIAETNNETENPLWHGEMHAIKKFFELPEDQRPATKDCIFLTTHEPCSLCLSGITWAGFDNFYYLSSPTKTAATASQFPTTFKSYSRFMPSLILIATKCRMSARSITERTLSSKAGRLVNCWQVLIADSAKNCSRGSTIYGPLMGICRRSISATKAAKAFRLPEFCAATSTVA